jgi:aspartate carbamoyltransferase catalytic subunit
MTYIPEQGPPVRHIISINDLTKEEIESIFNVAQLFLKNLPDASFSYRIGRSTTVASDFILASLFYEPSTRTRLSFESAMLRLGGKIITSSDPATSSAAKGESLADTVRVIANYADVIVIRHPRDGAARLAAEYSSIPIINGGDGSHEHPTQTLCDVFTLVQKKKSLKNLNVAISGDLKGSRTIHSFVYALALFNSNIMLMPAKGMELPKHVDSRLREEFHCRTVPRTKYEGDNASIDALYVTPGEPHQLSLIPDPDFDIDVNIRIKKKIDVVYVTRFQKERWAEKDQNYLKIDAEFLKEPKYSDTSVLHPLPRVDELDVSLDTDRRAVYFQQAAYGVPVRMALISLLLNLNKHQPLGRFQGGFREPQHLIYSQPIGVGIHCFNKNCIVHDPLEKQHARNKFYIIKSKAAAGGFKLRCIYCETDIEEFVVGNKKKKYYTRDLSVLSKANKETMKDLVIYEDEADALGDGLHLKGTALPREIAKRAEG